MTDTTSNSRDEHDPDAGTANRTENAKAGVPAEIPQYPVPATLSQCNQEPETDIDWLYTRIESELPPPFFLDRSAGIIFDGKGAPICGPLLPEAAVTTPAGNGAAIHLRYVTRRGREKSRTISQIDLCSGSGAGAIEVLADGDLAIYQTASAVVKLLKRWQPSVNGTTATRPGYLLKGDDLIGYVCRNGAVIRRANSGSEVIVPLLDQAENEEGQAGTLDVWCNEIGRYAIGNPELMFALSAAAAAPILRWTGSKVAAFLMHGKPGTGKTTILNCAASVMTSPKHSLSWFATDAATEVYLNDTVDSLAVLDEFPKSVDRKMTELLYAIGNGTGMARSNRKLDRIQPSELRSVVLISGEKSLEDTYHMSKKEMPEGLRGRFVNIPFGMGDYGCFDELHGFRSSRELAEALEHSAIANHGHIGPEIAKRLVRSDELREKLPQAKDIMRRELMEAVGWRDNNLDGFQKRSLDRMAVVALAGELLARYIPELNWTKNMARDAAALMLARAHDQDGSGDWAASDLLFDRISDMVPEAENCPLVRLDDVPFEKDNDGHCPAGWYDADYLYFTPDFFERTLAVDIGMRDALGILNETGVLAAGGERNSSQYKLPRRKVTDRPRCYRLRRAALAEFV